MTTFLFHSSGINFPFCIRAFICLRVHGFVHPLHNIKTFMKEPILDGIQILRFQQNRLNVLLLILLLKNSTTNLYGADKLISCHHKLFQY